MRILLAPMEGVVDHTVRDLMTRVGGIDRCVTEFVRVSIHPLSPRVFHRYCPELNHRGLTPSGTPVYVQLLGGDPELMAASARVAAELGAPGIDINFGCPTKVVNRNDGGSVILKEPRRVREIVGAVRSAVPAETPVTVKIRLGFHDRTLLGENARAIFDGGADELCIHARTKEDGYRPPAYWGAIAEIAEDSPIPIVANGEIWNVDDYRRCVDESGCEDVMLGRGALACPDLARQIKSDLKATPGSPMEWPEILALLVEFSRVSDPAYKPVQVSGRVKQWLGYLRRRYTEAGRLLEDVKRLTRPEEIAVFIETELERFSSRDPGETPS